MADDEEEQPAEAKEASSGKTGKGLVVVVLIAAVVLGGGAAAAGAVVAMRASAPQPSASVAPSASAEEKVLATVDFATIVVDVHGADGVLHHLRVALAAEVPTGVVKEDVQSLTPRGREIAIGYLRSLSYEEATAPHSFERIREELSKRIVEAVGEKRIASILLTDFVVQ